jgi:hypothetical protein
MSHSLFRLAIGPKQEEFSWCKFKIAFGIADGMQVNITPFRNPQVGTIKLNDFI